MLVIVSFCGQETGARFVDKALGFPVSLLRPQAVCCKWKNKLARTNAIALQNCFTYFFVMRVRRLISWLNIRVDLVFLSFESQFWLLDSNLSAPARSAPVRHVLLSENAGADPGFAQEVVWYFGNPTREAVIGDGEWKPTDCSCEFKGLHESYLITFLNNTYYILSEPCSNPLTSYTACVI